jgi:hypothetical protein
LLPIALSAVNPLFSPERESGNQSDFCDVPDTLGGRYYAEWDDQAHAPSRVGWGALAASMVV